MLREANAARTSADSASPSERASCAPLANTRASASGARGSTGVTASASPSAAASCVIPGDSDTARRRGAPLQASSAHATRTAIDLVKRSGAYLGYTGAAMLGKTLRTDLDQGVFAITLTRAEQYNTITPQLREELADAIDEGDAAPEAHVILLRAEGRAFCAGYELEGSTANQAGEASAGRKRVWDSVADYRMMSRYVATYMKLWYTAKPTIAAVQGWCVGGRTDMVLCADLIVAGEGARFGYPPSRVWGTPTNAM